MALIDGSSWGGVAINRAGEAPQGAAVARASGRWTALDFDYGGPGHIADTLAVVDPDGTPERPIARRVSLLDRRSLRVVRSAIADPATGAYAFPDLRTDIPFLLLADDRAAVYNAVVSDWVYAEV